MSKGWKNMSHILYRQCVPDKYTRLCPCDCTLRCQIEREVGSQLVLIWYLCTVVAFAVMHWLSNQSLNINLCVVQLNYDFRVHHNIKQILIVAGRLQSSREQGQGFNCWKHRRHYRCTTCMSWAHTSVIQTVWAEIQTWFCLTTMPNMQFCLSAPRELSNGISFSCIQCYGIYIHAMPGLASNWLDTCSTLGFFSGYPFKLCKAAVGVLQPCACCCEQNIRALSNNLNELWDPDSGGTFSNSGGNIQNNCTCLFVWHLSNNS